MAAILATLFVPGCFSEEVDDWPRQSSTVTGESGVLCCTSWSAPTGPVERLLANGSYGDVYVLQTTGNVTFDPGHEVWVDARTMDVVATVGYVPSVGEAETLHVQYVQPLLIFQHGLIPLVAWHLAGSALEGPVVIQGMEALVERTQSGYDVTWDMAPCPARYRFVAGETIWPREVFQQFCAGDGGWSSVWKATAVGDPSSDVPLPTAWSTKIEEPGGSAGGPPARYPAADGYRVSIEDAIDAAARQDSQVADFLAAYPEWTVSAATTGPTVTDTASWTSLWDLELSVPGEQLNVEGRFTQVDLGLGPTTTVQDLVATPTSGAEVADSGGLYSSPSLPSLWATCLDLVSGAQQLTVTAVGPGVQRHNWPTSSSQQVFADCEGGSGPVRQVLLDAQSGEIIRMVLGA